MSIVIRQLGPTDQASVAAFCGETMAGSAGQLPPHDSELSLMVQDDRQILALALARRGRPGKPAQVLMVATPANRHLVAGLVDKAILKLASAHMHKCKIISADGSELEELWQASRLPQMSCPQ